MPAKRASHPDAQYLMKPEIGSIIAKGLSVVYKEQPSNPVDFFAKWLLKQHAIKKINEGEANALNDISVLKTKFLNETTAVQEAGRQRLEAKKALDKEISDFRASVNASNDLTDNLQALTDHLSKFAGATACYIGKVVTPIKTDLPEDAFEDAHLFDSNEINPETGKPVEKQITWLKSTDDHKFLEKQVLHQTEGITYKLYNGSTEPYITAGTDDAPSYLMIPEVVCQKDIKFFKVPRLGSYLAIKLEYQSCISEAALDRALVDQEKYEIALDNI